MKKTWPVIALGSGIILSSVGSAFAAGNPTGAGATYINTVYTDGKELCTEAFTELTSWPGHLNGQPPYDYFLGRITYEVKDGVVSTVPIYESPSCGGIQNSTSAIALYKMNWATSVMTFVKVLVPPRISLTVRLQGRDEANAARRGIGSLTVNILASHDPNFALQGNEVWLTWECGSIYAGSASCIGPLVGRPEDFSLAVDLSRTTIPVGGTIPTFSDGTTFPYLPSGSASVPSLLGFDGHLYLYWSALVRRTFQESDGKLVPQVDQIRVRGMQLRHVVGLDGKDRLFAASLPAKMPDNSLPDVTVAAVDPRYSVEVLGNDAANLDSNVAADVSHVFSLGKDIYMVSSIGGSYPIPSLTSPNRCPDPGGSSKGCYRLEISRTNKPIEYHTFNRSVAVAEQLPVNAVSYGHIVRYPSGSYGLIGFFGAPMGFPAKPSNSIAAYSGPIGRPATLFPFDVTTLNYVSPTYSCNVTTPTPSPLLPGQFAMDSLGSLSWPVGNNCALYLNLNGMIGMSDYFGISLWGQVGKKTTCPADGCTAQFQNDGNFVTYGIDGAAWASGTYSPLVANKATQMTFSSAARTHKLSFFDGNGTFIKGY